MDRREDARYLILLSGLGAEQTASFCEVSPETVRRWRRDRPPSRQALKLLRISAGEFPWPGWNRWTMVNSRIYLPGIHTTPGLSSTDLSHLWLTRQEVKTLRQDITTLRRDLHACQCALATQKDA